MLTTDERVNFIDWVDDADDWLEESGNDTSIDTFENTLLSQCDDVLHRMPASEKFHCSCQEFMTAAEQSPFLASTGEDFEAAR